MSVSTSKNNSAYWKANLRLVALCLIIWFIVSFGLGVLFVEQLNQFRLFGFKLGFWFAQQGSIYVFLFLVFFYASRMNALDRKYGVSEAPDNIASENDDPATSGQRDKDDS
jgi:putative solute:sodium symporter small subunit